MITYSSYVIHAFIASVLFSVSAIAAANSPTETITFEADQLTHNTDTGEIRALGRVSLKHDGYVLKAGEINYSEKTGKATASGAVELTLPDGNIIYAPKVVLEDALKKAFVKDIRLLMTDGAQVAAKGGERDASKGITTLDRAVYSPCKVCADDPKDAPIWQIKAVKVVHDQNKHRLYYDDAVLEILGVPLLWFPSLSHPDPTVDRANGFLPAGLKTSKELGLVASLPYYRTFGDSADATITPYYSSSQGPFIEAEYRQNLGHTNLNLTGSITHTAKLNDFNVDTGTAEIRGHFSGVADVIHSQNWQSHIDVNWASDDTYLRRFDFSEADTLMSEYRLEGFYGRSYISGRAFAFQGLRQEDIAGLTAYALPLIDAELVSRWKPFGGTLSLNGNALALRRSAGADSQRISGSIRWQYSKITNKGLLIDTDAMLRTDVYNFEDARQLDDPNFINLLAENRAYRSLARITTKFTLPFINYTNQGNYHILEPIIEIGLSPNEGAGSDIINEDSRAFELTDLNIFSDNRAAGYDLWQDGSQVSLGLKWQYHGQTITSEVFIGQAYRFTQTQFFSVGTGLNGDTSNIVGHAIVSYKDWLNFEHRFRLDEKNFAFKRNETNLKITKNTFGFHIGYLKLDRSLRLINREDREEIHISSYYKFDNNWQIDAFAIQDLSDGFAQLEFRDGWEGVEYGTGISYIDDCIEVSLSARKLFTEDRDIQSGTRFLFTLKLKNLG